MRFTIKQLEYFVATGETGSIKIAAQKIAISQPSISSAISHLEKELKVQLFVRHHAQGLTLTPIGNRIMREAKLFLRQGESLYSVAGELQNSVQGNLSIGCMVTLAPMIAPELAHGFSSANPDVVLKMLDDSHEGLLSRLHKVEIDAAISYNLLIPEDVSFEPLADLPPQIFMSTNHPLAKSKSLSLKDLADEPMIFLDLPLSNNYFLSLFEKSRVTPIIQAKSSNPEVVRTMVANGYGYTIANVRPKNMTAMDGKEVVSIKLTGNHKPMQIGVMTLKQDNMPRILSEFKSYCSKVIGADDIPGMTKI